MLINEKAEQVEVTPVRRATPENAATRSEFKAPGWHTWIISKPFDWISTTFYVGAGLSLFYTRSSPALFTPQLQWWQILVVIAAILILLGLDRYEFRRWGEEVPHPVAIYYFVVRVGLVLSISWVNPNEITFFMYLILPFSALLYFGSLVGIGVALAVWVLFVIRVLLYPVVSFTVFQLLPFINIFTICLVFLMTTAYALIREKKSRTRAERLLRELEQSQRQVEELAATRERNRLARDIHDSLGHYLTVISVLLGKARAFKEKNPPEAEQALSDARRLANEALQDVRESVKSLRTSQELFSLERSLSQLVAGLQNEQLQIELDIVGSEAGFSKQGLMVLYRVAQEGLTNVQRHSGSDRVKIRLDFEERQVQLLVEDNGQGFDAQNPQFSHKGSYGLLGIQERLEMIGGELELDSHPGKGTRMVARVAKNSLASKSSANEI